MRNRWMACCCLLAACAGRGGPTPTEETPGAAPDPRLDLVGYYTLAIEPDAGWHRHFLDVERSDEELVRGRVLIDRGIGPEARLPSPDEIGHLLAFEVPKNEDGGFEVTLRVGQLEPQSWTLALSPKLTDGDRPLLMGVFQIEGPYGEQKGAATATPAARPADLPWPAWDSLTRGDQGGPEAPSGLTLPMDPSLPP